MSLIWDDWVACTFITTSKCCKGKGDFQAEVKDRFKLCQSDLETFGNTQRRIDFNIVLRACSARCELKRATGRGRSASCINASLGDTRECGITCATSRSTGSSSSSLTNLPSSVASSPKVLQRSSFIRVKPARDHTSVPISYKTVFPQKREALSSPHRGKSGLWRKCRRLGVFLDEAFTLKRNVSCYQISLKYVISPVALSAGQSLSPARWHSLELARISRQLPSKHGIIAANMVLFS